MSQFLAPQIVFLKQGTDTSQGKGQLISNMNACMAVVDIVRTTLGPMGMDKLIYSDGGNQDKVTISNDGATIVKLLDIVHPAAKALADISLSQDAEVGDGTTSVMVIAGEFLKNCKDFVEDGMHPRVIIKAYRGALKETIKVLKEIAIDISGSDAESQRTLLKRCAETALNSKLVSHYKEFFGNMVTDAVLALDEDLDLGLIGIKKVQGGGIMDSLLVKGVAFKKTFSYAGFEQQPKKFLNPKIILLNIELELKSEKENAEVRVTSTEEYQAIVEAEWNIIYDKLEKIVSTGAKVVLSRLAIGDLATQYFADRDIFCAGRVLEEDIERVQRAVGGRVQTTVNNIGDEVVGTCEVFEEKGIGGERYNVFMGCPKASTATMILRGGSEQFMAETERSLHDAIMIVRRALKYSTAVAGAGAIEMELSKHLREHAMGIHGREQAIYMSYAKALEVIPRTLCDNAGHDSIDVLNKLRAKHAQGGTWYGVDIRTGGICDAWESFVWEPALVKINAISAATEAACLILSIDETVKNPQSEQEQMQQSGQLPGGPGMPGMPHMPGMGRGRGRGMRRR
eukprot:Plantae.Rhodophyta-Purpureofilum_apyrenoidigerum.ctg5974.p2 GENE.Plantae.Rhodophyta-Purpureofilum_apyrenoidigerum.ctg5974~~Plantae.Rhodophyta-Purpureofilum_apyrenoidigerum.ctg5974.p2  ORF type:complete len:569 (-),score=126.82 Plantae.Rhodophyta-Purpureofilum_apyrenoidigerum.ctg5974:1965-3671(-)